MVPLIPNTDDLISLLDRVLDKGITIESWVRLSLFGCDLIATDSKVSVASSSVYVGYGKIGTWRHVAARSGCGRFVPFPAARPLEQIAFARS